MVEQYSHILLATDLLDDSEGVVARAAELAQRYSSRLSVIHVVEQVPVYFGSELAMPAVEPIEIQLVEVAREKMAALAQCLGIDPECCHVEVGATKSGILSFAEREQVTLIVIGSHSRHGLERLLGATAKSILNSAVCDVLAVKIK